MSLPSRLGWGLALLAALAVLAPALAFAAWVRWEQQDRRAMAQVRLQADLVSQREAWERRLEEESAALVRRLHGSSPAVQDLDMLRAWAQRALAASHLDLLWVLSEDGSILACGHWPARAGGRQTPLLSLASMRPQVRRMAFRDRDVTGMVLARSITWRERPALLVAGLDLVQAAAAASPPTSRTRLAIVPAGEEERVGQPGDTPRDLLSASVTLDLSGAAVPLLAGRRPAPPPPPFPPMAGLAALVLAAALVAGGGGAWLGRRALAPLGHLDEMAAALSRGHLEMELEGSEVDEFGRLAESFNRMIVALRRQRRELETTARLAAWRDAARRMAHEVKNPLAPIRLSVENLIHAREHAPDRFPQLFQEECRTIIDEVDALTRLVDTFSRFARLPEPQRRATPAADLARHVVRLHRDAAAGVELQLEVVADPGVAEMDPDLVGQVLKNLVLNALAVVPKPGGRVWVKCEGHEDAVSYQVRDNGPGIPAGIRDHLFEPRVSSRPGGTGLGLAVAKQIVTAHDGRLDMETGREGTCFTVRLPRMPVVGKES